MGWFLQRVCEIYIIYCILHVDLLRCNKMKIMEECFGVTNILDFFIYLKPFSSCYHILIFPGYSPIFLFVFSLQIFPCILKCMYVQQKIWLRYDLQCKIENIAYIRISSGWSSLRWNILTAVIFLLGSAGFNTFLLVSENPWRNLFDMT